MAMAMVVVVVVFSLCVLECSCFFVNDVWVSMLVLVLFLA